MKTKYIIILTLFFSITISRIQAQINHQLSFDNNIKLDVFKLKGVSYYKIVQNGTFNTEDIGNPSIPVKYLKLLIPCNAINLNIEVKSHQSKKVKLKYKVAPCQNDFFNSISDSIVFINPNNKVYNTDCIYPEKLVKIVEESYFRGNRLLTLAVSSCQYYPLKNELQFFDSVSLNLNFDLDESNTIIEVPKNEKYRVILEKIVDNPSDIDKFSNIPKNSNKTRISQKNSNTVIFKSATVNSGIQVNCDYVIVTSQNLAPAFNEFIAWKRRKGVKINLVTIEEIDLAYSGDEISGIYDKAGKLRQFLFDAYNDGSGIDYALLAGDGSIVPLRYTTFGNSNINGLHFPTDFYYSEFNGDWNVDNNENYGDPNYDDVEYDQEIYVGRLLVSNSQEIKNWTRKVLNYELNPGNDNTSYLTKALFSQADNLQENDDARYCLNQMNWITDYTILEEEGGFDTNTIPNSPTGKEIIDEFNNHYGISSFMGHGSPQSVRVATGSNAPYYKLTSFDNISSSTTIIESGNGFDNMSNTFFPSINYSISCYTNSFDNDYSMGKVYTCVSNGGGPAYLGNTRLGIYGILETSRYFAGEFFNTISSGTSFNIGKVEGISKQSFNASLNNNYVKLSHNLTGCPETEIWTAIPSEFTSPTINKTGSTLFINTGESNSTICVMSAKDNGNSYYQTQPASGYNYINNVFFNVPNDYLVTITKHNFIPYTKNPDNIYFQNETLTDDAYIYAKDFHAGYNVTNAKPVGNFIINSGSSVVFNAEENVYLESGFEVELGAEFETK